MAGSRGLSAAARGIAEVVGRRLPEAPIVVALSGGADSAVLAWAVLQSRPARALSIDHGLAVSAPLMAAADAIAHHLGIEVTFVQATAGDESETALRSARLAALEGAVRPGEVIATGHTRDDAAETVLGNVLRGTGTSGLAGIPSTRTGYVRPMLEIPRAVTRGVAEELGLPFADDPTNLDRSIRRNRLRLETIPQLAAQYNPQLGVALYRLGRSAAADDAVLEGRAAQVPVRSLPEGVAVPAAALQMLPTAVAARVARRAIRAVRGPHGGTAEEVEAVLGAAFGARATIAGAIGVVREGPWVVLLAGSSALPEARRIDIGRTVSFGPWLIGSERGTLSLGRFSAVVPEGTSLVVRTPQAGDRISVGAGTKAVGDALAEAGVVPRLRGRWPVVESDGTIAWIPGVRVAPIGDADRLGVRLWARRTS